MHFSPERRATAGASRTPGMVSRERCEARPAWPTAGRPQTSGDRREPRAGSASMRAVTGVNRESANGDGVADRTEATGEP
ncbi:hypothetical protein ACFQS5_18865 [Salinirubellus sp. GCM10025899]